MMGTLQPKYMAEPDLSAITPATMPTLKLCTMAPNGHLQIPPALRAKWLQDPIRGFLSHFAVAWGLR